MWKNGVINGYQYEAKVYDFPGRFGINKGKISKLWIYDNGKEIVAFDRGWDKGEDREDIWKPIVNILEGEKDELFNQNR